MQFQTQSKSAYLLSSLPINFFITASKPLSLLGFAYCLELFVQCFPVLTSHLPPNIFHSLLLGLKWLQMIFRWLQNGIRSPFTEPLTLVTVPLFSFFTLFLLMIIIFRVAIETIWIIKGRLFCLFVVPRTSNKTELMKLHLSDNLRPYLRLNGCVQDDNH